MGEGRSGIAIGGSFGLLAGLMLGFGMLVALIGFEPSGPEVARECRFVAEVARDLGVGSVIPKLKDDQLDCGAQFAAAGVPLAPPPGRLGVMGTSFSRPRFIGTDRAVLGMDLNCGPLCGHGTELYLRRGSRGWVVTGQLPTWIS